MFYFVNLLQLCTELIWPVCRNPKTDFFIPQNVSVSVLPSLHIPCAWRSSSVAWSETERMKENNTNTLGRLTRLLT